MSDDCEGSVSNMLGGLKAGGNVDVLARELWGRYFDRLVRLARARLAATPRGPSDEEDVALCVFDSFVRGAVGGRFPLVADREDLWKLLVTITARKVSNLRRHEGQLKRGGGRVVTGAELVRGEPGGGDPLARVAASEPTPEFAAAFIDELRSRFGELRDESLRVTALLRMEGHSNEEIAAALD
jgi:DNA-directed RNA polymerase specialized sigma24 family protein